MVIKKGPDPVKSLASLLHHSVVNTLHNGTSDTIPATVSPAKVGGPQGKANISPGEYVIPADIVSHLGNGDTESGSKVLDQMIANIRQQKTGSTQQPDDMSTGLSNLLNPQGK